MDMDDTIDRKDNIEHLQKKTKKNTIVGTKRCQMTDGVESSWLAAAIPLPQWPRLPGAGAHSSRTASEGGAGASAKSSSHKCKWFEEKSNVTNVQRHRENQLSPEQKEAPLGIIGWRADVPASCCLAEAAASWQWQETLRQSTSAPCSAPSRASDWPPDSNLTETGFEYEADVY